MPAQKFYIELSGRLRRDAHEGDGQITVDEEGLPAIVRAERGCCAVEIIAEVDPNLFLGGAGVDRQSRVGAFVRPTPSKGIRLITITTFYL